MQTSSPLEISQNILADGSITKQAGTDVTGADNLDDNLTVDPGITIQSLTSSITLDAGNNIWIGQGAQLEAVTGVTLDAGYFDTGSLAAAPIDATVNFGVNTTSTTINGIVTYQTYLASMTLSQGGTWSGLAAGDQVLIGSVAGGSTADTTPGDNWLTIASVSGATVNFVPQEYPDPANPNVTFSTQTNEAVAITVNPAAPVSEPAVDFAETCQRRRDHDADARRHRLGSEPCGRRRNRGCRFAVQQHQRRSISADRNHHQRHRHSPGVITFAAGNTVDQRTNASVTLTPVLRDVKLDSGSVIDTTNVPQTCNSSNGAIPRRDGRQRSVTIDSAGSVNILGATGQSAGAIIAGSAGAIDINAGYLFGQRRRPSTPPTPTSNLFGSFTGETLTVTTGFGDDVVTFIRRPWRSSMRPTSTPRAATAP